MGKFTRMNYDDMFAEYGNIFLKFYENDPVIAEHEVETFPDVQKTCSRYGRSCAEEAQE